MTRDQRAPGSSAGARGAARSLAALPAVAATATAEPAGPPALAVDADAAGRCCPDDVRDAGPAHRRDRRRPTRRRRRSRPTGGPSSASSPTSPRRWASCSASRSSSGPPTSTRSLDGLAAHHYDAVMSAMTDTPERRGGRRLRQLLPRRHRRSWSSAATPRGIHDLDDLCGETVAVEDGTVQVDLLGAQPGALRGRPDRGRSSSPPTTTRCWSCAPAGPPRCSTTTRPR